VLASRRSVPLRLTGMLAGRSATSHWSRLPALERTNPEATWARGHVYVDDGDITTTGAVTSGVPAALHLVAGLAGTDEAQRVADLHPELGWTPASGPVVDDAHFGIYRTGLWA
jgi:transcriptional regulator GlxA family with amidase domain